jgi:hypothetical protein
LQASLLPQPPHFCLDLLQPVRHAHLAVHRRRGGEVLPGLLALVRAVVELAEAEVAVGDEGAHAELVGEGQRFAGVGFTVPRHRASTRRHRRAEGAWASPRFPEPPAGG